MPIMPMTQEQKDKLQELHNDVSSAGQRLMDDFRFDSDPICAVQLGWNLCRLGQAIDSLRAFQRVLK